MALSAVIRTVTPSVFEVLVKETGLEAVYIGVVYCKEDGWHFTSIEGVSHGPFETDQKAITALLKSVWGK